MAGPGGREIARLAARVLPDTSGFATSLQRYLDRIEQRARVQVKVTPDLTGFAQEMQARLDRVRAQVKVPVSPDLTGFAERVRAGLSTGDRNRLEVPVVPDVSRFRTELETALARSRRPVRVPVQLDVSRAEMRRVTAQLRSQTVRIDASINVSRTELRRLRAQLTAQRIRVPVQLDLSAAQVRALRTQLRGQSVRIPATVSISEIEIRRLQAELSRHRFTIQVDVDGRTATRIQRALNGGSGNGNGGISALSLLPGRFAAIAAAASSAVPVVSSLAVSLAQMAPAAAVGATGLVALGTAAAALKIGSQGVGDALKNAFDPKNAEKYNEALAKLTPNARSFVTSIKGLEPQFSELRKTVQERLFGNLGKQITAAGAVALPVLRKGLAGAAGALNGMGLGVIAAGKGLSSSGQLGQALTGANKGLANLQKLPGQVVTGFTQIAVAAAPAFDRLTAVAGKAGSGLADKISAGLKSGGLTRVIDQAVSLAGQLFSVLGNVGRIIGNVFGPAAAAGGNFLGILKDVTGELAKVTATKGVQDAFKALFGTMAALGKAIAPLIGQALAALGPVLTALGPPAQRLIAALGAGLSPIITALGPVLAAAASAVGALVDAVSPLLPVIGQLVASLLPALTPLLAAAQTTFAALAPVVAQVASILTTTLAPIIAQLPALIAPLAAQLGQQLVVAFGLIGQLLTQLAPSLAQLGVSFGQLLVAVGPVTIALIGLINIGLRAMMPVITLAISAIAALVSVLTGSLARQITSVVVPALAAVSAFLSGNFSAAWAKAKQATVAALGNIVSAVVALPGRAASALAPLAGALVGRISAAGASMVASMRSRISAAISEVRSLPGRAASALGGLGGVLVGAGASLISGFVSGIRSRIGSVKSVLQSITNSLPSWKGPPKRDARILTPAGRSLIDGFIKGIDGTTAKLRSRLESITKALPANVKSGYGKSLKASTAQLTSLVKQRDGVITKLSAAEKNLAALSKERTANATKIREGILSEADITQSSGVTTAQTITSQLQQQLAQAKKFAAAIAQLRKRGLRSDLLDELGQAGVSQGSAAATALANASDYDLKQINKLQSQLAAAATSTGNTVADAMYSAGVQSAKGLVAGLQKQKKQIEATMIGIAKSMQKAIKKALGIHSPAKKLIPVGVNTVRGVLLGLDREQPQLASAMVDLVSVPRMPALAGSVGAAAAGGGTLSLTGQRMALVVDGHEFSAYVDTRADGRVQYSNGQLMQVLNAGGGN